jgi:hypothetical protein
MVGKHPIADPRRLRQICSMSTILSAVIVAGEHGGDIVHQLLFVLVVGVCLGLFYYLVNAAPFIPDIFKKVLCWIIILVGVLFLVNVLLGLVGHPFIASW